MKRHQFLVAPGKKLRLKTHDPAFTDGFAGEEEARPKVEADRTLIAEHQDKLKGGEAESLLRTHHGVFGLSY